MRVLIPELAADSAPIADALRAQGHEPVAVPLIVAEPAEAKIDLAAAQAFLVSGPAAARALADRVAVRTFPVYADSAVTAGTLLRLGFRRVEAAGDPQTLARLIERALTPAAGAVIHPCAAGTTAGAASLLTNMGFAVRPLALFSLQRIAAVPPNLAKQIRDGEIDAAIFVTPEAARATVALLQREQIATPAQRWCAIAASPLAAAPLQALTLAQVLVREGADEAALASGISEIAAAQTAEEDRAETERRAAEERTRLAAERAEEERRVRERDAEAQRGAAEERVRLEAEQRAAVERAEIERRDAEERARVEAEQRARLAAELAEEELRKAEAARREQERREGEQREAEARAEAERAEAERREADDRAHAEAERQARLVAERKAEAERRERTRLEAKARAEAERRAAEERARLEATQRAAAERAEAAHREAEEPVRVEAERQARLATERAEAERRKIEAARRAEEQAAAEAEAQRVAALAAAVESRQAAPLAIRVQQWVRGARSSEFADSAPPSATEAGAPPPPAAEIPVPPETVLEPAASATLDPEPEPHVMNDQPSTSATPSPQPSAEPQTEPAAPRGRVAQLQAEDAADAVARAQRWRGLGEEAGTEAPVDANAQPPVPRRNSGRLVTTLLILAVVAGALLYAFPRLWTRVPEPAAPQATATTTTAPAPAAQPTASPVPAPDDHPAPAAPSASAPTPQSAPSLPRQADTADNLTSAVGTQAQQLVALSARVATLEAALGNAAKLDDLAKRLQALEAKSADAATVLALSERVRTLETTARAAAAEQTARVGMLMAISQWHDAIAAGRPYQLELETVKALSVRAGIPVALDDAAIAAHAGNGIATLDQLRAQFEDNAGHVLHATAVPNGVGGWLARSFERLYAIITIRRVDGLVQGDTPSAILARAGAYLKDSNLAAAVTEMEALKGPAAEAAQAWLDEARARVAAERAATDATTKVVATLGALSANATPAAAEKPAAEGSAAP